MLLGCAALVAVCLYVMNGSRALYFALAPTLVIYGTMNWDLLAVAFATLGAPRTSSEDARWPPVPRSASAPPRSSTRGCWRSP